MEAQTVRRTLKYEFTEAEKNALGQELAVKNQELRSLEDQKKSVTSEYGSRITIAKEQISSISDKVASGYEMRETHCAVQYHFPERNKKTLTRTDTGEPWIEPMTDTDHNLFNQWEEKERKRMEEHEADNTVQFGDDPEDEGATEFEDDSDLPMPAGEIFTPDFEPELQGSPAEYNDLPFSNDQVIAESIGAAKKGA